MTEVSIGRLALAKEKTAVAEDRSTKLAQNDVALVDLGWHKDPEHVTHPVVDGMSNEDVWLLIRRFNKAIFCVKERPKVPAGGLDLVAAVDEDFSPNKMRSQVERLYMGVILGVLTFFKHISRVRSWRESRRTAAFCTVYFVMWVLDLLTFLILVTLVALIVSPQIRTLLFPPAPVALMGSLSGSVTKPNAGMLGSTTSATGAPENMRGEAVENEASNFVTALGAIAMNIILGKDPQGEPNTEEESVNFAAPTPNKMATKVATAKDKAEGVDKPSQDKTKVPMETIMWSKMQPIMHDITMVSDIWEKFVNLLNPKPPFHPNLHRLRLASLIVPLAAASMFLTRDVVFRGFTFSVGVVLFGDPILTPAYCWLNQSFPESRATLQMNNTILNGVPTNSQLALTLLRLGEATKAPLPPPPRLNRDPSKKPVALSRAVLAATGGDQPLGASDAELQKAVRYDEDMVEEAGGQDVEATQHNSKKHSEALNFIKRIAKTAVRTGVGIDHARAKAGHGGAKNRVGVIPSKHKTPVTGPVEFDARYQGQKGYLCLNTHAISPFLAFNKEPTTEHPEGVTHCKDPPPIWSLPIEEITELRKHSGYGFKSKLLTGWALNQELNDSLGISDRHGSSWAMTAIPCRDELFNRLIAIGKQKWETR